VSPTPAQQAQARRIAAELAALGFALPGTLADRMTRCGRPNCRCHADPPRLHGPYHQWTRKKNGKTATRILTGDYQRATAGPPARTGTGTSGKCGQGLAARPTPRRGSRPRQGYGRGGCRPGSRSTHTADAR
jgi:hypothetical protein